MQVRPSGSTVSLDAPLLPSTLLSIWAQLPASTPLGPADVTLTVDGQASAPARIMVTRTNFGLFTQAGNGLGAAIAQNQDAAVNKLTNPALPGQYVTLWGTGLGSATADEVTIQLGGTEITPVRMPDLLRHCLVSIRSTSRFPIAARWMAAMFRSS